jgi:predicted Fe-Mo cluster-binding NifX family protein
MPNKRSLKKGRVRVAVPLEADEGLDSSISSHIGMCPYFLIADVENNKIVKWETKKNPGAELDRRMGLEAVRFLVDEGVKVVIAVTLGEGPFWMLGGKSIKAYRVLDEKAKKIAWYVENYKKLEEIKEV